MAVVTTSQNLTAVSYAAGEILDVRNGATLTINATPGTRPGTIQCITSGTVLIQNTSTSVPVVLTLNDMDNDVRIEGNGVLTIRGAWLSLGSGTGAAQTFDFTTLFGGTIPEVTYCEIETSAGSGVFVPWPIVHEDPKFNLNVGSGSSIGGAAKSAFTAGNTEAGRVLF